MFLLYARWNYDHGNAVIIKIKNQKVFLKHHVLPCLYNNKGRLKYGYVYIGLIKMLL